MEHHRPHERDGDGRRHHRHREYRPQHAAPAKFAVENERGNRAEDERQHHRQQREVERVPDRLEEALIGREIDVVVEADEVRDRPDLPVEGAHPYGEQPRKYDHRADDEHGRHDEAPIVAAPSREERGSPDDSAALRAHRRRHDVTGTGRAREAPIPL